MGKFKQFLGEQISGFDLEAFKKDCRAVISLLPKGECLYRGIENYPEADWTKENFRLRTKPRDSSQNLHDKMNAKFIDMFGEPIRNWMFVTSDVRQAASYADGRGNGLMAIFPIGQFSWASGLSPKLKDIRALFYKLRMEARKSNPEMSFDQCTQAAESKLVDSLDEYEWAFNTKFDQCIEEQNEVMLKCESFYSIRVNSPLFRHIIIPALRLKEDEYL